MKWQETVLPQYQFVMSKRRIPSVFFKFFQTFYIHICPQNVPFFYMPIQMDFKQKYFKYLHLWRFWNKKNAAFCVFCGLRYSSDNMGARVLKNFGAPLATKFTYKMRSGGKGMWGRGPALYKHNYSSDNLLSFDKNVLSRESGEEDRSATGLLLRTHSAGPVSQTCYYLKVRAGYALQPSMTRLHNAELVN
jgi:hypothetical protein